MVVVIQSVPWFIVSQSAPASKNSPTERHILLRQSTAKHRPVMEEISNEILAMQISEQLNGWRNAMSIPSSQAFGFFLSSLLNARFLLLGGSSRFRHCHLDHSTGYGCNQLVCRRIGIL